MLNYKQIVGKLIAKRKSNHRVIAACIYGSYAQGLSTPSSDLNVLLITKDTESYEGCYMINGVKVVYFEKPFITIMNEIEQYHKLQNPFYASLFRTCEVIFDTNQMIPYLQYQQVRIESYKSKVEQLELDDFYISFYNSKCNQYFEQENSYFEHYYYVLLEYIRKMYHQENGYSTISAQQVPSLYLDSKKASHYHVKLPDNRFQEFFLECILKEDSTREEKKRTLKEAFGYLKTVELSQACVKELNTDIRCIPNCIVAYLQYYQKLVSYQTQYGITLYPYHNLVEQIGTLNNLCNVQERKPFLTDEEYHQLVFNENPVYIAESLNKICKQIEVNPNQYEIPCFQKKYKS